MGITADNLKPYHKSNSTSDSLANLILNNLGYDKSKQKERIIAIMTTLKLINYLNHNNVKEAISTINALKDELARNIINLDDDRFIEELNTNAVKITQKVLDKMHISTQEVADNLTRIYAIEDKNLIKHKTPENMLIRCGFDAQKPISIEEILSEQKRLRDEKAAIEIAKQNELKKQNDEQRAREAKREAVTPIVESKIDETKSGVENKTTKTNLKDKISDKGTAKKSAESKTEKRTVSSKTIKEKESAKEKDNTKATKPRATTKQKEANSILNKITLNKELETEEKEQLIEVIKTSKERFDITNTDGDFEKFMLEQTNGFILEIANFISNVHTQIDIVISNKSNTLNFNTYMEIYPFKKAKALSLNYHFSKLVKNKGIEDKNVALAIETLDELLEHNKAYNVALQELKDVEDLIAHHLENESKNESIV